MGKLHRTTGINASPETFRSDAALLALLTHLQGRLGHLFPGRRRLAGIGIS